MILMSEESKTSQREQVPDNASQGSVGHDSPSVPGEFSLERIFT